MEIDQGKRENDLTANPANGANSSVAICAYRRMCLFAGIFGKLPENHVLQHLKKVKINSIYFKYLYSSLFLPDFVADKVFLAFFDVLFFGSQIFIPAAGPANPWPRRVADTRGLGIANGHESMPNRHERRQFIE